MITAYHKIAWTMRMYFFLRENAVELAVKFSTTMSSEGGTRYTFELFFQV